jgi:hypothetical protein
MPATPEVGQSIEFRWPSGDSHLDLTATVRNIEESNKMKQGSKYVYTLDCCDGATRKTRLLCLDWAMGSGDNGKKSGGGGERKQKRPREGDVEVEHATTAPVVAATSGGDGAEAPLAAVALGKNAKKKARWTDGRNASTEALARTVYVRQIPYAATEKDLAKLFKGCATARLLRHEDKTSKGMAFVEFKTEDAAASALGMQGVLLQGRPLSVTKCVGRDEARGQDKARLEARKAAAATEGPREGGPTAASAGATGKGGGDGEKLDEKEVTALVAATARGSHGAVTVADFDSR